MHNKLSLSLVTFLLLLSFALASRKTSQGHGTCQQECQINRITAQEPTSRLEAEGGVSELWDDYDSELQCAGVALHSAIIKSKSLVQPLYHNSPVLLYIIQGRGMYGIVISGCPETFESSQQSQQGDKRQIFLDKHQKIEHYQQGDVLAIPAGAAHWIYNAGDEDLVILALLDTTNKANQLDTISRTFPLAGSRGHNRNIFRGFDAETLVEVFGVDYETASTLRGENEQRGQFIKIPGGLHVISPPIRGGGGRTEREEYQPGTEWPGRQGYQPSYQPKGIGGSRPSTAANGIEETICTAKNKENINNPARVDVYNPLAGQLSIINSLTLPILSFLQLSVARGVLHRNAIMAPHWCVNANRIMYIIRGDCRMQIVDHRGQAVFDGIVTQGQAIVVPQNYAVVKQAGEQGAEWVVFNTNDNAMINTLSGRTSALRGIPSSVIANAYQISDEQAQRIKYNRQETLFFSGSRSRAGRSATPPLTA